MAKESTPGTAWLEDPGKAAAAGAVTGATIGLVVGPIGALIGAGVGAGAGAGAGYFLKGKAKKAKKKARNKLQAQEAALAAEQRALDQARLAAQKAIADRLRAARLQVANKSRQAAYRAAFLSAKQTDVDAKLVLDSLAGEAVEIGKLAESTDDLEELATLSKQADEILVTLDRLARDSGLGSLRGNMMGMRGGLGDMNPNLGPWLKKIRETNRVISGLPPGPLNLGRLGATDSPTAKSMEAKSDATRTILVGLLLAGGFYAISQMDN